MVELLLSYTDMSFGFPQGLLLRTIITSLAIGYCPSARCPGSIHLSHKRERAPIIWVPVHAASAHLTLGLR